MIEFLLRGEQNPSSILGAVASARENLRTARPVVPREAWEACNNLWLVCSDNLAETESRQDRVQWLRRVIAGCQRINGILLGTMSRDEAMSFLLIGQNLERADLTTRVLDVRSEDLQPKRGDDPYDVVHWMAVLRSLAAYQPFRRAMPARPQGGSTLRFLLQDARFPRAVSACLTETRAQLKGLARAEEAIDACNNASMLVATAAVSRLTLSGLSDFLDEVQVACGRHPRPHRRDLLPPHLRRMATGVRRVVTAVTSTEPQGGGSPRGTGGHGPPAYAAVPGRADEYLGPDGTVRTRWRQVAAEDWPAWGRAGSWSRRTELARLLRNEGATYNVNQGVESRRQPWTLDPCPLVVDGAEWSSLESAVSQRVALLDLVLSDIYGERRLVAEGRIPAQMVLGHPGFLRACVDTPAPGRHRLFLTAVDVVRDDRGEFRAVGDRTEAPSGLGYALVNRTILSRVLPNLHREPGVERLAGFFRSIRAGVAAAAPDGVDEPRVVILTPGPLSETYFEHAYLASYLGYALVEGRDLVVNNNRVWLRSLAGFDPVDVVIRRVDGTWWTRWSCGRTHCSACPACWRWPAAAG